MPIQYQKFSVSALRSCASRINQPQHERAEPTAIFGAVPSIAEISGVRAAGSDPVPQSLRGAVFAARMSQLISPSHLAELLGAFSPPIDPESPEWCALKAALDAYDHATYTYIDLEVARTAVNVAANAVIGCSRGSVASETTVPIATD
ncbi:MULTISPECIES: hypothetical protein [Parafrankia]|nr:MULTISPECIES: hypothetical protein [Parafrankia]